MGLIRKQNWEDDGDFHGFLMARAKMPFVWGGNDCALFAADAIESITGTDIAADFRGKYTDETGAFAAIKSVCDGTTVADAAAYCAGKFELMELKHPLMAKRGDLVVMEDSGRLIAGVVHLNGHLVSVGEDGLKVLPITAVRRAWHY